MQVADALLTAHDEQDRVNVERRFGWRRADISRGLRYSRALG
jgi:hypothetical protein